METFLGIMIPFLGTALGAACVFFMKKSLGDLVQRALAGFAAGVMVAASIWSLLIPAIEQSEGMGKLSFLPAFIGFWVGVLFLLLLDHLIPHLHVGSNQAEGPKSRLGRTTMMVLAVTLHNIPEGMAVGVMYAGFLAGNAQITAASALVLSLGIAIQNFPEGAIISMPLRAEGESKGKAFFGGVLSGVVEPIGAVLTLLAAQLVIPALPYFLSFAAGAMLYVVVEELIPEGRAKDSLELSTQHLHEFVAFMYDHFDEFKLILCRAEGTGYADFIEVLVDLEVDRSEEYYALLRKNGMLSGSMTRQLHHMITRAYFTAVCETIVHDMPREEAVKYIDELAIFFHSGWSGLLRLE